MTRLSPWKNLKNLWSLTNMLLAADLMWLFHVVKRVVIRVTKKLSTLGTTGYLMLLAGSFLGGLFILLFISEELFHPAVPMFAVVVWGHICALRVLYYLATTKNKWGVPEVPTLLGLSPHLLEWGC